MKTYTLRTVYEAANLAFSIEGALRTGNDAVYLVRERKLPYSTYETVGVAQTGDKRST